MARTTPELVATVVEVDASDDEELAASIDAANFLVDDQCLESGYAARQLELIERYLAAHFYTVFSPRATTESVSGVSETVQGIKMDYNLGSTIYGQQAMLMDTAGNLAALNNQLKVVRKALPSGGVGTKWLGRPLPDWWSGDS